VNGANQNVKAKAPIFLFSSSPQQARAVIDLSAGYPGGVRRTIWMLDRKRVVIQDDVQLDSSFEWNFHTPAKVEIENHKAILSLKGAQLLATLLSPEDGKFEATDSDAPDPQKPNPGVTNLVVHCSANVHKIVVLFCAVDDTTLPAVEKLEKRSAK